MLSNEKILKNAKKYFSTGEKYGFLNDELKKLLGDGFINAPATNREDLHGAYEGGLIEFILLVTKNALLINDILNDELKVDKNSLIKVCLLFQIGKTKLFTPQKSDWHKSKGINYEFNNDITAMRVGERSAYYALICGINLTEEEYQAIINFDKGDDDKQAKWHSSVLALILRQANELAIIEQKNKKI
jgi:hypothetical protein